MSWWAWLVIVVTVLLGLVGATWAVLVAVTWNRANRRGHDQRPVPVDVQEYRGRWYELARYDRWFQRGCTSTTADYEPDADGRRVRVTNRCLRRDGKVSESRGWAVPTTVPGQLAVSFFPGIYGAYTVIWREADVSMVSSPDRTSLWILSRTPRMDEDRFARLTGWLKRSGYDTSRLVVDRERVLSSSS